LRPGDQVKAEVANVDSVDRRLTLSMRNPGESAQAEQLEVMRREQAGKGATLGDVFKDKLKNLAAASEAKADAPASEAFEGKAAEPTASSEASEAEAAEAPSAPAEGEEPAAEAESK
jgi:predicted RNA-binding protein with RPS1 domain